MIKQITRTLGVLHQKSAPANVKADQDLIIDLLDTAYAHEIRCAGLAAIQIETPKRVIVVKINERFVPMINPLIIWRSNETYIAEEGCLAETMMRAYNRGFDDALYAAIGEG